MLEIPFGDKHSSLFATFVNSSRNKLYDNTPYSNISRPFLG